MIGKLIVCILILLLGIWIGASNADFIFGVLGG